MQVCQPEKVGRILRPTCAVVAAAFAAQSTQAQDLDGAAWIERLDQITVTATRIPTRVEDSPATVSVKSAEQIADELATDIKNLVRFEPGVSVTRQPTRFGAALGTTGRGGNEGFNIRGIGGNRVLIQVDGVRVPDGFTFGAQSAGRGDYVDIGLVKSVEILRGPASALYGSDGLAGAVSFTTADPADFLKTGASVGGLVRAAYQGSDQEFAETAIVAARGGGVSGMVAYTSRDYQELENRGRIGGTRATRTQANPQDGRSDAVLGRLVLEPGGGHRLRLTGEYLDTRLDTDVLTGLSATVDSLKARDTGSRKRATLDWSWAGEGIVDFARAAVYWQDGTDVQFTDEDRTPAADRERLNTFDNEVIGASADARSDFATGALAHRLVFGGDISVTRQKGLRDGVVPPAGEVFPTRAFPKTDFTRIGLFVADELRIGDGLVTVYPALRFDHYRLSPKDDPLLPTFPATGQQGSRLSPKLGVVVKPAEAVRLFANYATGFKAPEPSEVNQFFENIAVGYTSRPNPDLGPERSESFEGGVRLIGDGVSLELTAFHADYKDFISQEIVAGSLTPADPAIFQFINLDRVKVKGLEARFEGRTRAGFHANGALSWAKGDVIDGGGARSPLSTIDPLKLVAGLGWRDPGGRYGSQLIATHSARKGADRTAGVCTGPCYRPAAFTILDATAFVRIGGAFTLRAGLFNLTNEKYAWWSDVRGLLATSTLTDAYTQPGRHASLSLTARF